MRRVYLLLLFTNILSKSLFAVEPVTESWSIALRITIDDKIDTLWFGTKESATDTFDFGIDELAPPPPPSGISIHFNINGFWNSLSQDYRSNKDSVNTWILKIQNLGSNIKLDWDASDFPLGDIPGKLKIKELDMLSTSTYQISEDTELTISYEASKKYIGVPIIISTQPISFSFMIDNQIFSTSTLFDWQPGSQHTLEVDSIHAVDSGKRYLFDNWSCGGSRIKTFTVPDTAINIEAIFQKQFYLDIQSKYGFVGGSGWYEDYEIADIKVDSIVGVGDSIRHIFNEWSGAINSSVNPTKITMDTAKTVIVSWDTEYKLFTSVIPDGSGNIELSPSGPWYLKDSELAVKAVAQPNFRFSNWLGGLSGTDTLKTLVMNNPKHIQANFKFYRSILITSEPIGLHMIIDGDTVISPKIYEWDVGSQHTLEVDSILLVDAGTRYMFSNWSNTKHRVNIVTVPDSGMSITANFFKQFYLFTGVNDESGGAISPKPPGCWCDSGDTLWVTARPDTNFQFDGWEELTTVDNPILVTMDTSKIVTARFSIITDVANKNETVNPSSINLLQNYPNPFNPNTNIKFNIPEFASVSILIFNCQGQKVRTLISNKNYSNGYFEIQWNGKNDIGEPLPSGIYYLHFRSEKYLTSKKLLLMK